MAVATVAHSQELLHHLIIARKYAPNCLRSLFELGWLFWKEARYGKACVAFKEVCFLPYMVIVVQLYYHVVLSGRARPINCWSGPHLMTMHYTIHMSACARALHVVTACRTLSKT